MVSSFVADFAKGAKVTTAILLRLSRFFAAFALSVRFYCLDPQPAHFFCCATLTCGCDENGG
jgi:hypothetical protein